MNLGGFIGTFKEAIAKRVVEPEAVGVNGNGHHAIGHAAVPVNGNGHHDEAPESQRPLLSWAEFMAEEPVKPKGRKQKPQPTTLSMFKWALELEREREKEPVSAGR